MPKQLGFLVDLGKCVGCRGCEVACGNRQQPEPMQYRRVVNISRENQVLFFLSLACNHCMNPECIRVCKEKCFYKRQDGVVLYNSQRCNGCRRCLGACPFQAPKVNPRTKKISKCDFCFHQLDQGLEPACAAACIVGALQVVDILQPLPGCTQEMLPDFSITRFTKPSTRVILPKKPQCFWRKE